MDYQTQKEKKPVNPAIFSSLYGRTDKYYCFLLNDQSRSQDLVGIKTIYGSYLARVEHNLRKNTGLSLRLGDVQNLDAEKLESFKTHYPFFATYSQEQIEEYLKAIVQIRDLNTHFTHWATPKVTPNLHEIMEAFHPLGKCEAEGQLTFFGMAMIVSPLASSLMTHDIAFSLIAERDCFGPNAQKMAQSSGPLANAIKNTINPPFEDKSLPFSIRDPFQYNYLCPNFYMAIGRFFLETEKELSDAIKDKADSKGDYFKNIDNDLIDMMDLANYLPGDRNQYLRHDIQYLRNAVFHGNFLEETVQYFKETRTLTLDYVFDVFKRWADALDDKTAKERQLLRTRRCLATIFHLLYARPIQVAYKLRYSILWRTEKAAKRANDANKALNHARDEIWVGFKESMAKWFAVFFNDTPCQIEFGKKWFESDGVPLVYEIKDSMIFDHYSASKFIAINGVSTNATELTIARIPNNGLSLTTITDMDGHTFKEKDITKEGILEIHHFVVDDNKTDYKKIVY